MLLPKMRKEVFDFGDEMMMMCGSDEMMTFSLGRRGRRLSFGIV
jgi:hypothetical protein